MDTRDQRAEDDACRCKETANMTPRELLQRMMDDLAFWRKGKEEERSKKKEKRSKK